MAEAFNISRGTVSRHYKAHVLSKAKTKGAQARQRAEALVELDHAADIETVEFASPKDVLDQLTSLYNLQLQLFRKAEASHDVRVMNRCMDGCGTLLDKLAKAFGLFASDGAVTVNLTQNSFERRIEAAVDQMSQDELAAYLRGTQTAATLALAEESERAAQEHIHMFRPLPGPGGAKNITPPSVHDDDD